MIKNIYNILFYTHGFVFLPLPLPYSQTFFVLSVVGHTVAKGQKKCHRYNITRVMTSSP
jgi:hypothetical protein